MFSEVKLFFQKSNCKIIDVFSRFSQLEFGTSKIDAKHNYWGYNKTLAVGGRIRDYEDSLELLKVDYRDFYMNNQSLLNGKCPPAWDLVGDTCYILIGAPMDFFSARDFCRVRQLFTQNFYDLFFLICIFLIAEFFKQAANASMPFVMNDDEELYRFLKKQQERYDISDRVWIQQIDKVNQCTMFTWHRPEIDYCGNLNSFICEIGEFSFSLI